MMHGLENPASPWEFDEDEPEAPPHVLSRMSRCVLAAYRRLPRFWQTFLDAACILVAERAFLRHLPQLLRRDASDTIHMTHSIVARALHGDPSYQGELVFFGVFTVLLAPLIEELLNRGLPILLARWLSKGRSERARRTIVGTIAVFATVLFAWLHNPVPWALPLPQLLFGAIAWRVAWGRGLRYSILLHGLNNLYVLTPFALAVVRLSRP